MNAFTVFALLLCAILAMVSGEPVPSEDIPGADALDDVYQGAESQYRGGGGGRYYGGGRFYGGRRGYYGGYYHGYGR